MKGAIFALGAEGEAASCFHCGLPIPAGERGRFCCAGCEVMSALLTNSEVPERAPQPVPLATLALYDQPAVRDRFVRAAGEGLVEADFILEGMTCAACAWLIERRLERVAGVASVHVNYSLRRAHVEWRPAEVAASAIFAAVYAAGYKAWPYEQGTLALVRDRERRTLLRRFLVAALGMMQVMMYAYPAYIATEAEIGAGLQSLMRWAGLLLTLPVLLYSAAPFFRGAWRDIRAQRLGMDLPIALGLGAAFVASAVSTVRASGAVYFDSVTMFVFLVMGGRYLEHIALDRASRSLQRLAALTPILPVAVGDRVLVMGGDALPADGVICADEEHPAAAYKVNESLLTGESDAVTKRPGDKVIGGSVNCGDAFTFEVTHAGGDTVLSTLRRMMESAIASRPRWVEMAERASGNFVALVVVCAFVAGATWLFIDPSRAAWIAISVLIVTCPCALSLATPVAMMAATGALARCHVVVTNSRAIEALATATDFVFDKTGTLTEGKPQVREILRMGGLGQHACIALAAAIGRYSRHPLDRAFAESAARLDPPHVNARTSHPGLGIEATCNGRRVRLGRIDFVAALVGHRAPVATIDGTGTLVWLGGEDGWIAAFRIGDGLRSGARQAVGSLRESERQVHLLTGDDRGTAMWVAGELGIAEVEARATPARKQAYVSALQLRGARVAVVGDGINDTPALGLADVSIAMGSGAHLAQVSADAVLLSDSLGDLAEGVRIARRARRVIRENLAWALAYNLVVLPLAFAGLVTPLVAAIGMSASSLLVVANALRVR